MWIHLSGLSMNLTKNQLKSQESKKGVIFLVSLRKVKRVTYFKCYKYAKMLKTKTKTKMTMTIVISDLKTPAAKEK